jgi:hypothetical protein
MWFLVRRAERKLGARPSTETSAAGTVAGSLKALGMFDSRLDRSRRAAVSFVLLAANCTSPDPSLAISSSTPTPASQVSVVRRLRRLSSREYDNVVRDLLGDGSKPSSRFVVDVYPNGYDNGAAALAVQSDQVVNYQSAAETLAAAAVQSGAVALTQSCNPLLQTQSQCIDAFLSSFGARAFRRPLTQTETQRLADVYKTAAVEGYDVALQTMLEVMLQSPQFLYREELGPDTMAGASGANIKLTGYEVASELSFLVTGSLPDDTLWAAVQSGQFTNPSDYQREASRLLATPAAQATMRAFLHRWLGTDSLSSLTKSPEFYPGFDGDLSASMNTELEGLFDDVLWHGTGSLRELFTSSSSHVDSALGALYDVDVPGPGFSPVQLDTQQRPGVLTRAAVLAAHSDFDSSGPIGRGVFVLQSLLCSTLPPRPPNIPAPVAASDPSVQAATTRQRFDRHVSEPFCASCHTQIDGVGFGFEGFDGIGAFRTEENGQPVDSRGTLIGTGEIDGDFDGVGELTARLSSSRVLAQCFARQAYRYAMGQVEGANDSLSWLSDSFSTESSMLDAFSTIISDPVFLERSFE